MLLIQISAVVSWHCIQAISINMKERFLNLLSQALNHYLKLDSQSDKRLQQLEGKIITIELLPFHYVFQCIFKTNEIQLKEGELFPATAKISGTPLLMCGAVLMRDKRHHFFAQESLVITGDAGLAQQVIELFDEMEIDWEEYIAQVIGDVPAYHLGRVARRVEDWLRNTEKSFERDVSEYIHEEIKLFPPSEALQDFYHEVDSLRMDVDRIEARINSLIMNEDLQ